MISRVFLISCAFIVGVASLLFLFVYTSNTKQNHNKSQSARVVQESPIPKITTDEANNYGLNRIAIPRLKAREKLTIGGGPVPNGPFLADKYRESSNIPKDVSRLVQKVENGEPRAAYELYEITWRCRLINRQLRSAEERIDLVSEKEFQSMLSEVNKLQPTCDRIPEEYASSPRELLELAADGGVLEAKLNYITQIPTYQDALTDPEAIQDFRVRAHRYLVEAVNAGSVEAMMQLAGNYYDGLYQNAPNSRIAAAGLMLAADRTGLVQRSDVVYSSWSDSLTTKERSQAEQLAERILMACCQ